MKNGPDDRKGRYEQMKILQVFADSFLKFDFIILILFIANLLIFFRLKKQVDRLYFHFNASDRISNLREKAVENLKNSTTEKAPLSPEELLDIREKMNQGYAWYANFTTMFPLFGMLGTVYSLIRVVGDSLTETSAFFSALTSTAWGIVAAIIFKALDSTLSYKIEDNEKHTEHLLFMKE